MPVRALPLRGAAGRDCGAVAPRPARPGGRGPRTLALGACRSGSRIQVMSLHCANMNQWSASGSVGASPVQGEFCFVLRGAGVCRPGGLVLRDLPPMVGRTSGRSSPSRIDLSVITLACLAAITASLHELVTALSRAPPAIGGPWWVALAPGSFGDPLRGQGAGRRSHLGGGPHGAPFPDVPDRAGQLNGERSSAPPLGGVRTPSRGELPVRSGGVAPGRDALHAPVAPSPPPGGSARGVCGGDRGGRLSPRSP